MINTIFYFPLAKLTYSDYAAAVQNGEISGRTIVLDKTSGKIFNQGKEYGYSVQEIQNLIDTSIEENRFDPTELQTEISDLETDLLTEISGLRADLQQLIVDIQNQSFKGDKGEMSFTSNVFKRSATKPNKPGANEGSFSDPVPSGWSDGVPAGTDSIWTTKRIFSSDGQYPQQASWEDVQLMSDTESFDVEFSPIESNPGTPTTNPNNWYDPTADTNADWTNMIWMATRTKSNGVWGNWNVTKIKGEKGEKGDAGSEITFDDTEIRNAIATLNSTVAGEKSRLDGVINNLDNSIQTEVESLLDDATWVENNFPEGSGSASNFGQQDVENYLQTIGVWSNDEVHNKTNAAWSKISQSVNDITSRVATLETNGVDTESLSSTINQKIANGEIQLNLDNTYARKATVDDVEQIIEWMYSGLKSSTGQDKTITELTAAGKNGLISAIADIRTQVDKLENGDYLATTSVDAKVKDSISGMLATADGTTAAGRFFTNVGAALTAGLITEANLSTKAASAGLMASSDFTAASILAQVNNDTSNVKIKADKIDLLGVTTAEEVIIKNGNNLEAGMTNGNSETVDGVYRDGVRIWAGTPGTVNNRTSLANCPFYVTNSGAMHADNANISGNITATGGRFTGEFRVGDATSVNDESGGFFKILPYRQVQRTNGSSYFLSGAIVGCDGTGNENLVISANGGNDSGSFGFTTGSHFTEDEIRLRKESPSGGDNGKYYLVEIKDSVYGTSHAETTYYSYLSDSNETSSTKNPKSHVPSIFTIGINSYGKIEMVSQVNGGGHAWETDANKISYGSVYLDGDGYLRVKTWN